MKKFVAAIMSVVICGACIVGPDGKPTSDGHTHSQIVT